MTDGPWQPGPWSPPPQNQPPGPGQWGPPSVYGSPNQPGPPGQYRPAGPAGPYGPPGSWGNYGNLPYVPPTVKRTHRGKLLSMLVVGLLVVGAVVAVASRLATPSNKPVACQPVCDHPPTVMPVSDRPLYVGADKAYSVRYDPTNSAIRSTTNSGGVTETLHRLDGGVIKLFGLSASGRSARQVARDVIQQAFPDAHSAYQLPNAIVGFQPGYGEVDDVYPQSSGGTAIHDRLIVMVAIKNDVALVGEAFGPYDPAKPGGTNNDGHATGASLLVAQLFDPLVNTFSWQGDPVR